MDMKELRMFVNMSQREFAGYFGIPLGTLRNWEQGIAKPPEYVFNMIMVSMRRDKMINVETIKFVKMLDELAKQTIHGVVEFAEANEENSNDKVFYDKRTVDDEGCYKVVLDKCVIDAPERSHHDAISYYGDDTNEYCLHVRIDEDEGIPYIEVKLNLSDEEIVIENGHWYFV